MAGPMVAGSHRVMYYGRGTYETDFGFHIVLGLGVVAVDFLRTLIGVASFSRP